MIPSEPAPMAETPPAPDWLPVPAQERYYAVCQFLRSGRSFADTDAPLAVRYAAAWHRWMKAEQKLAEGEPEFIESNGRYGVRLTQSASRRTSIEASRELSRLEKVLGLSPADRKALQLATPMGSLADDLAQFFPPEGCLSR